MAWTAPPTFVAGTTLAAADLNKLGGDLTVLGAASASYGTAATVWTATSVNPVINNGTFVSTYRQDSKWVDVFIQITMGSTTTYGTGTWQIGLPVTAKNTRWTVAGEAFDTSGPSEYVVFGKPLTTSVLTIRTLPSTAGNPLISVGSTAPMTWATGDILTLAFRYEAA